MSKTECLPRETLKEYLAGWSDQEQSDQIEAHLAQCQDCECEQAIAAIESDPDTLIDWIRNSSVDTAESEPIQSPSQVADDANLAEAIERSQKMLPKLERPKNWTPPDEDIGMYELLRPLGCGGMGSVYLARHRKLNKQVAIKLLPARSFRKEFFAARFEREIRAAGEMEHPAIVRATDAGEHEGIHYLVMEHIDGLDLSRLARRYGPMPIADACELMRSVALGLAHAHGRGIIHRDIKPSNLMLNQQGETKILDFGLARVGPWEGASAELTTVGQLMGTLDYMAPEQAERPDAVDYRADLYSLGATLFRLLAGRAPLAASPDLSPLAKLRLMATHEAPRLGTLRSDAPEELVELVADLLARDPVQRPPSANHVAERLGAFTDASELPQLLQNASSMEEVADPAEHMEQMQLPTAAGLVAAPNQGASAGPQADMAGSGKRRIASRWLLAAMLPLMILAGILIALETQKGQLVIQSEAEASVTLLKDGKVYKELKIVPGANSTRIYSGKYQVELATGSDSLQLKDDDSIEVIRGRTVVASLAFRRPTVARNSSQNKANSPNATLTSPEKKRLEIDGYEVDPLLLRPYVDSDQDVRNARAAVAQIQGKIRELELSAPDNNAGEQIAELKTRLADAKSREAAARDKAEQEGLESYARSMRKVDEPVYEGKPLSHYLQTLAIERSSRGLGLAFVALRALADAENAPRITDHLLRILPQLNGKLRIERGEGERLTNLALDYEAFNLLERCNRDAAYSNLIIKQLSNAEGEWLERLFDDGVGKINYEHLENVITWMDKNVLSVGREHPLFEQAVEYCIGWHDGNYLPENLADQLSTVMSNCKDMDREFWITIYRHPNWNSSGKRILRWARPFSIETLNTSELPPAEVAQAALQLIALLGSGDENTDLSNEEVTVLKEGVIRQLSEMDPDLLLKTLAIGRNFRDAGIRPNWNTSVRERSRADTSFTLDSRSIHELPPETNLPAVLLELAELSQVDVRPQCEAIQKRTRKTHDKIEKLLLETRETPTRFSWPQLTPSQVSRIPVRGQSYDRPMEVYKVQKSDWIAYFLYRQAGSFLPSEEGPEEKEASSNATQPSRDYSSAMRAALAGRASRTNSVGNSVLFRGRPLNEWINILPREKSKEGVSDAIEALVAMITPETEKLIQSVLERELPKLSLGSADLARAFDALEKIDEPRFRLYLLGQLKSSENDSWRSIMVYRLIEEEDEYEIVQPAHEWIVRAFLKKDSPLTGMVARRYKRILNSADCHPSLMEPLAKALLDCEGLDDEFWLGTSTIEGSKWAELSYAHAMKIWKDLESSNSRVLHAADFLSRVQYRREIHNLRGGAPSTTTLVPSEAMLEVKDHDAILAALRDRLAYLLENPNRILEKVPLPRSSQDLSRPDLPFYRHYRIGKASSEEICYGRILTCVTSRLFLGRELPKREKATPDISAEIKELLVKLALTQTDAIATTWSKYHQQDLIDPWEYQIIKKDTRETFLTTLFRGLEVTWPLENNEGKDIEQLRANLLFAELIHLSGESEPFELALVRAQELATKHEALQHDANQDGKLSYKEFEEYQFGAEAAIVDLNGDKSITVDELNQFRVANWKEWAERLEKSEARAANEFMMDKNFKAWVLRTVAKYDKDKDGKLSKSEVQKMLIKPPAGTDKNNDGFISVQEYAEMRAKRR